MSVMQPTFAVREWERTFYTASAVAMAAVVFAGFARTFFLRAWFPDVPAPTEPIFVVHGAVFAAWMILLVVQTSLIATGRASVHRGLGVVGALLAVAIVVLGVMGALVAARRPGGFMDVPLPPLQFLIVPLTDMTLFGTFAALAVVWRRHAQTHKRLMLIATVSMLTAAFVRVPMAPLQGNVILAFVLADVFIVMLLMWDLARRGRPHPVTLWAGGITIVSQPLKLALAGTPAWLAISSALVG